MRLGWELLQSHATSVCGQQERRSPWRQNVSHWVGFLAVCLLLDSIVLTLYMFGLYCTHLPAAVHTRGLYNKWAILSHWSSSVVVCVYVSVGLANWIKLSFMSDGTAHAAARKWTGSLYTCAAAFFEILFIYLSLALLACLGWPLLATSGFAGPLIFMWI